ncbi:MAG: amino acid adenylation domain-containing protein [Coprococcus sp.]|nr:amino acid adenylation domain-containing protein [Coprococcus sp.]
MEKSKKEELVALLKNKTSLMNLTSAQKRLLFVQMLEEGNSFYNNFAIFRVDDIEYEYFKQAIDIIVSQSVLLRSKIINVAGKSYFCEVKDYKPEIDKVDFTGQGKDKLDHAINEVIRVAFPFDHAGLYKIAFYEYEGETYLVFNFHHILLDGWSLGLFFSALTKYYNLLSNNKTIQVEDYVLSDNFAKFSSDEKKDQIKFEEKRKNYWKEKLADYSEFEFPLDKMRPNRNKYVGKKKELAIEGVAYTKFIDMCKSNRITVFSGLMTLFYMLLVKYTQQTDITLGTVHANRLSVDYEKTIGTFLNTLPVRINIEDHNISFIECAKAIQKSMFQDQINQMPFDNLVESLNLKRDTSKNALFQILFIFQNMQLSIPKFDDSKTEYLASYHNNSTRVDLELHIWEKENKFIIYLFYNSELFYDETIDLLLEHYHSLFLSVTETECPVSEIQLPPVDIDAVITQKITDEHKKCDICKGLDDVIAKTPDKVAIVFEEQHITYSALGKLINYYEKNILSLNFKKDHIIGVYMDRSIEMVAMLHAILRSGCGYVPIERSLPMERILDIIEDTQVECIIHNVENADKDLCEISSKCDVQFLSIDQFKDCSNCSNQRIRDNDLAYIIYTSGSTGKTKGVMLTRENLQCYLYSFRKKMPNNGTWLAVTNYNFDLSVVELIWTLYYGNRVVLTLGNSKQFLTESNAGKLIKNCHVTHIQMVPTLSKLIFDSTGKEELDTLEYVMLGGEYSTKVLLETIRQKSTTKIVNMYGPTETTIFMTFHEISSENETDVLGEVYENVAVKILDEQKRPVPKNVPGELYVGGPCVCKGYMNREELVREKFSMIDGMRFYQTGDICKINSKNRFIILGRNDRQIKLNGFRIEIDEIETDIMMHSEVRSCSVQLCGKENLELVAFISVSDYEAREKYQEEIHALLKRKLPFYMIPSKYVFMETLPINTNGKTDVKKLKEYYLKNKDAIAMQSMSKLESNNEKRLEDVKQWINKMHYEIAEEVALQETKEIDELAILFAGSSAVLQDNVISKIRKVYNKVVIVNAMDSFREVTDVQYGLNIRSLEDYRLLYERVLKENKKPVSIFSLWGLCDESDYDAERFNERTVDYFYFLKSLSVLEVENIKVGLLAMNSVNINADLPYNYNSSFLQSASICFNLENKSKQCVLIDMDDCVLQDEDPVFESIIQEFNLNKKNECIVRQGHYYEAVFEQVELQDMQSEIEVEDNSAIIIVGGLSGIGLEMATFLSSRTNFNFVLVARSVFPDRAEWDKILEENLSENQRWINGIKKIRMIEENSCNVIVKCADATSMQDLTNLNQDLKELQVHIKGVIYCAAKGNSGYLNGINEKNVTSVLDAKTTGTSNVMKVFGKQVDFVILNSSLCSKLGGVATYDYCAANVGLDTYANYMNNKGCRIFDFSWDTWKETGMAYDIATKMGDKINTDDMLQHGITNDEAYKLFEMLFSEVFRMDTPGTEFMVSVYPMAKRYEKRFRKVMVDPTKLICNQKGYQKLLNGNEKVEFSTNVMRVIWSTELNRNDFSEEDNFFDIGGNSIMLIRVQNMMKNVMNEDVPLNILYNYPTIKALSEYMAKKKENAVEQTKQEDTVEETTPDRKRLGKRLQRIRNHENKELE